MARPRARLALWIATAAVAGSLPACDQNADVIVAAGFDGPTAGTGGTGATDASAGTGGSGGTIVENPTGSCTAPDSGVRPGFSSLGTSVWLPDCQNTLRREYWRVFAQSSQSAAVKPRPDGASQLGEVCGDPQHELHDIAQAHFLCQQAATSEQVARVNDIPPADALKLTHFMHTRLRFAATGVTISPFAIPSDIIDACALHPSSNSADFEQMCERERGRLESGLDVGFAYEGPGAVELASALNELYAVQWNP